VHEITPAGRQTRKTVLAGVLGLAFYIGAGQVLAGEKGRWYSDAQLARGESLFLQHCAACHGRRAEGTSDWKRPDANGNYPPPPLNGTAHAWHHDLEVLRRSIRQGGKPLGGVMPAFADRLGDEEIDSVIAYFQSQWPDEVYRRWAEHFGVGATSND